jgi:hypothetical protein
VTSDHIKIILKYQPEGKTFRKTYEIIEEFCFVISVTALNRPHTEKNDDDDGGGGGGGGGSCGDGGGNVSSIRMSRYS